MMFSKVLINPFISGIEIAQNANIKPSVTDSWQPFYNSNFSDTVFKSIYTSLSLLQFHEVTTNTDAGYFFTQKLIFSFPITDESRAKKAAFLLNVKFVKIIFTNGTSLVLGRNDFSQNAAPKVKLSLDIQICEAEFEGISIAACGYSNEFYTRPFLDFNPI